MLSNQLSGRQCFLARLGPEADDLIEEFLTLTLSYEQEAFHLYKVLPIG